jgi:hypothetical protein
LEPGRRGAWAPSSHNLAVRRQRAGKGFTVQKSKSPLPAISQELLVEQVNEVLAPHSRRHHFQACAIRLI